MSDKLVIVSQSGRTKLDADKFLGFRIRGTDLIGVLDTEQPIEAYMGCYSTREEAEEALRKLNLAIGDIHELYYKIK